MSTLICFLGIEIVRGYFEFHTFFLADIWIYTFIFVFFIWITSKILKKTRILDPKNEL